MDASKRYPAAELATHQPPRGQMGPAYRRKDRPGLAGLTGCAERLSRIPAAGPGSAVPTHQASEDGQRLKIVQIATPVKSTLTTSCQLEAKKNASGT